ncbi:MAG: magnesium/cobalt transporter CorA [Anaerolineales bacterium]
MQRSLYLTEEGKLSFNLDAQAIADVLASGQGLLWVDLCAEPDASSRPLLEETFGFHPLSVDDALEEKHVPKIDDWGEYLYLTIHALQFDESREIPLSTLEIDVFLGRTFLVTYTMMPIPAIEQVWEQVQRDERILRRGAQRLLYSITDEMATNTMPVVEAIDEAIDHLEDAIFESQDSNLLERIFTYKRALLALRRILMPQREVFNKLARGDFPLIETESRMFFRDVYDHLVRLHDITEGLRDLVTGALDTYLSVVSNRMNEVMKTLTIITTLFMPIAFLTGFFGTNFFQPAIPLPAWTGQAAFYIFLAAMVFVPAGMYFWMRRRAWA